MNNREPRYVIAIVDDDQRVLLSLGNLLESAGYSVRLFDSAEAFLSEDVLNDIDALISDIKMPGMDGIELQRQMGMKRPQLPVILITAGGDPVRPKTQNLNNLGVFNKPVDPAKFLRTLGVVLKDKP
jgi:FixJ family two-component response regulator